MLPRGSKLFKWAGSRPAWSKNAHEPHEMQYFPLFFTRYVTVVISRSTPVLIRSWSGPAQYILLTESDRNLTESRPNMTECDRK